MTNKISVEALDETRTFTDREELAEYVRQLKRRDFAR